MATAFPSPAGYRTAPPVETMYDESRPGFVAPASFPGSAQVDRALAQGGGLPTEPTTAQMRDARQTFEALTPAQRQYVASQVASGQPAIVTQARTLRVPLGRDAVFLPARVGVTAPSATPPVPGQAALVYRLASPQSAGLAPPVEASNVNQTPAELVQFYNQQSGLYGRQGLGMNVGNGQATFAPSADQVARATAASVNQATGNARAKQMVQWAMQTAARGQ